MLPISALPALLPHRLQGLLFDLDDTLLDHSKLSEAAYSSLFRLREAGFECYAVTGRPASTLGVQLLRARALLRTALEATQ